MQNSKCHLSCVNVLDCAAGKSEWLITCMVDGHTRNESVDCPFTDENATCRHINPTVEIFHAMNNMNNYQKGQKETMLESNTERHKRVCYELNALYDKKNRDYGDSFHESWKDYGITMAAIRLGDKYNRLKNLTSGKAVQNVADETVRDTLLDLANYSIMTLMELDAESEPPEYDWKKEN